MQLLAVWAVLVAAAVPGGLADVDLFCDCRVQHHQDWTYALHCTRNKNEASGVSCGKAEVPEIPPGYNYVPGYGLIRLYRTFKPWAAAKKFCEDEGAQLAVPPDRYAYDGLKQIFPKEKGIWYAYVGISDRVSEGVFVGMDGRPVPYLPWQPNEPNNGNGVEEDCVDVRNDGLLNDVNCENPAPFLCERQLSVGLPDGYTWSADAGRFYKVHTEKRTYADAAEVCHSENATLAVTDTWRRGEALLRLVEPKYDGYFIGFTDEAVEGDFVTETGRHLKDMEFQVWGVNEPNNVDGGKPENCLTLTGRGYYNDVLCDKKFLFICEIAPV
ncbi:macrophage mannose receptor 1-like [Schistocerca gregaria]|uniref:macrophage mannose receptor 1-like n=1 Tax=Schistocerca gregaria TaxID=7010 RepID=UPI00211F2A5C|nr:macrophage mannose receptor 1-like [Schistocerca gregaria]